MAQEGVGSTWEFLAGKYDRSGDGAITPAEYERPEADFARLDADQDGVLTGADFPDERWARDLGLRDIPPARREQLGARYAARAVVLTYFQPDPGGTELTLEAFERGFDALDRDGSGALEEAELARATAALPWCGPGEAWELLLAAMDAPGDGRAPETAPEPAQAGSEGGGAEEPAEPPPPDGRIARAEAVAYHAGMAGESGVLRGPPGAEGSAGARGYASDGPPVGSPAPDFALAPPEGGERVRLSEWRGKKPVALVFGSYT
jgi:hypothetical protein